MWPSSPFALVSLCPPLGTVSSHPSHIQTSDLLSLYHLSRLLLFLFRLFPFLRPGPRKTRMSERPISAAWLVGSTRSRVGCRQRFSVRSRWANEWRWWSEWLTSLRLVFSSVLLSLVLCCLSRQRRTSELHTAWQLSVYPVCSALHWLPLLFCAFTQQLQRIDLIAHWGTHTVLTFAHIFVRSFVFLLFFSLSTQGCYEINNFNSLCAIYSGLHANPIHRLKKTWDVST